MDKMNPSAQTEFPIHSEFDGKHDLETKMRERLRMCLESIGKRLTMTNEEGEFIYWIPGGIQMRVDFLGFDNKVMLVCTKEVEPHDPLG